MVPASCCTVEFSHKSTRSVRRQAFADAFNPQNNAFGFLRLVLAVLVIYSHSYRLGGFGLDPVAKVTAGTYSVGLLSVGMFFVLSGFLISRSAFRALSVRCFLWHRFLRIFPGYWICLLVCGFVLAPVLGHLENGSAPTLFSVERNSPQAFVWQNATLFHFHDFSIRGILSIHPDSIRGLFAHNPTPSLINGSLWTLPFEFAGYLAIAALAFTGILKRARALVLLLFLALSGLTFSIT